MDSCGSKWTIEQLQKSWLVKRITDGKVWYEIMVHRMGEFTHRIDVLSC